MKTSKCNFPTSVYRLQLSEAFTFKQATEVLPYLKSLGIEAIYCSPYYDAYSPHGYDITNPNALNPRLGTYADFMAFCETIKALKMKQLIDVVPNHMGIKGGKNAWWQDVLENGPYSEFAGFFDINWSPEKKELQDRVLLPILGVPYGKALEKQEIKLFYENGSFFFRYKDYPLPLAPPSYAKVLDSNAEGLKQLLSESHPDWQEYQSLIELYRQFPVAVKERGEKKEEGRKRLNALIEHSREVKKHIKASLIRLNGSRRNPQSFNSLDQLLEAQFYRLSYWKVAHHEINYRRFFNIQEMAAICIEKENVLDCHHRWLFELLDQGHIHGLRIDHPDGLYDPVQYFERLKNHGADYVIVEKILDRREELPLMWQVEGTVGYEYLNILNGLFIKQSNEKKITEIYEKFIGFNLNFDEIVYLSKKLCTHYEMVSEVASLGLALDRLSENSRNFRDFTRYDLTQALAEVIASFPVYRTYVRPEGKANRRDSHSIKLAVQKAKEHAKDLDRSIFDFLEKALQGRLDNPNEKIGYQEFALRFQQLTGSIMAKGLEDTAFYIYNRFISLNEVGGDPMRFGYSITQFHQFNSEKRTKWPYGFLASSTHDAKRSEDVRMRLNVLSEIPDQWDAEVEKWAKINQAYKKSGPTPNAEYLIYQTLVGIWPLAPLKSHEWKPFVERLWKVIQKSLREAKQETNWDDPNLPYEESVQQFLFAILDHERPNPFLKAFLPFQKKISHLGALNSLSATGLKIASCGVADIYQGNEMFNFCLVDPDNRQPVDFELRKKTLAVIQNSPYAVNGPIKAKANIDFSKLKCLIHQKGLLFRRAHPELFLEGEYLPLRVRGKKKEHLIAFMRTWQSEALIVVAARFFAGLEEWPLPRDAWNSTEIILPNELASKKLVDQLSEKEILLKSHGPYQVLAAGDLFERLPLCFLYVN